MLELWFDFTLLNTYFGANKWNNGGKCLYWLPVYQVTDFLASRILFLFLSTPFVPFYKIILRILFVLFYKAPFKMSNALINFWLKYTYLFYLFFSQ